MPPSLLSHAQDLQCACSIYLHDSRYHEDPASLFQPKQLFTLNSPAGTCFALVQETNE